LRGLLGGFGGLAIGVRGLLHRLYRCLLRLLSRELCVLGSLHSRIDLSD
jgi:hypothetical protein